MNCFGCGITLQTQHETKVGFIPPNKMKDNNPLCKRCFSLTHYNSSDIITHDTFDPVSQIQLMNIKHSIIMLTCDVYSFSTIGKLFKTFKQILKDNKVWIIVNKIDLLPKSINLNKLREKIIHIFKTKYNFDDVLIISTHNKINIDNLLYKCHEAKKNAYLLGYVNSGKSSIANAILQAGGAKANELITKSHTPNTTLGTIKIPISKTHKLVDLPGIPSQLAYYIQNDEIKKLYIKGEQKTITFQLEPKQMIYFDNLGYIELISGVKTNMTFYVNSNLKLHRTKSQSKKLNLDFKIKLSNQDKVDTEYKFSQNKTIDIEMPYIGFIRFQTSNQQIKIVSTFPPSIRKTII